MSRAVRQGLLRIAKVFGHTLAGLLTFACALALSTLVFLLLPLMQRIATPDNNDVEVRTVTTSSLDAPPPPPEPEPEQEEQEEEQPPELTEEAKPLDLSQLELALNPGMGGGMGGGDMGGQLLASMGKKVDEASDALFSFADLDQMPRPVFQAAPEYPSSLKRQGVQGTVYLLFIVNKMGRVEKPQVQKSTHPAFEKPALKAIRRWRFEPGKRNGKPVQFRMRLPITFVQ